MQDRNGNSLKKDDEVVIKGKVLGFSGEGSRHVIVQTEDQTRVTLAGNQLELAVKAAKASDKRADIKTPASIDPKATA